MTDQNVSSGEANQEPVANEGKNDVVAYESYQKVLNEKKNVQAKMSEIEKQYNEMLAAQKAQEEAKLNEQGEYQKLVELKDQKIKELESKMNEAFQEKSMVKKDLEDTWKLQAFYQKLNGNVKRNEYLSFVDLDSIVIDPETRQVDETSVENVVSKFMENHGDLVQVRKPASLPSDAPKGRAPKSFNDMSKSEQSGVMQELISRSMVKKTK